MQFRVAWIDSLRGIGILLVVIIHATGSQLVRSLLLFVAVPTFFFVSGFLFDDRKYTRWTDLFFRHLRTRMFPYAVWVLISYGIALLATVRSSGALASALAKVLEPDFLAGFAAADFNWLNGTVQNGPLWFLPCLFLIEILFYPVARLRSATYIGTLLAVLSLGTYLVFSRVVWLMPFIMNMVLTNILFFGLGFILKRTGRAGSFPGSGTQALVLGIAAGSLFIGGVIMLQGALSPAGKVSLQYLISFSGIVALVLAARYGGSMAWLRYIGSNTLIILVLNEPLRRTTNDVFALVSFSFFDNLFRFHRELFTLLQVLAVVIFVIPCIYVINHQLPFLIGKFSLPVQRTDREEP